MDQDLHPGHVRYSNVALDVSTGRLSTLHGASDEEVEAIRPRCRSLEVRCPVEGCESPELSATIGYVRGDGTPVTAYFSHKAGGGDGGHGPESYAIARIKHAIRDWALALGHSAEVDANIPGTEDRTDVLLTGPSPFVVELSRNSMTRDDWEQRTSTAVDADRVPLWLWLSPGGGCLTSFQMKWVIGKGEELNDIWFAGVDEDGEARLAMARHPRLTDEPAPEPGKTGFPALTRPAWLGLSEIGLSRSGFVDRALLDRAGTTGDGGQRVFSEPGRHREDERDPRESRRTEATLFGDHDDPAQGGRSTWSPEELSKPGTRWCRQILHDRRHQAFLDGLSDLCSYDWGIDGESSSGGRSPTGDLPVGGR